MFRSSRVTSSSAPTASGHTVGPYQVNEYHVFGPNTVIAGTAAGPFKSADGDVLVLGFHGQIMYDENGNLTLEKWTGACP